MQSKKLIETISMCVTVLNEITHIRRWIANAVKLADEINIIDGGSTDGTVEVILEKMKEFSNLNLVLQKQEGRPYLDWQEGKVKQQVINMATKDLVLVTGADELICYSKREEILHYAQRYRHITFRMVPFWGDRNTVRLNVPNDEHWMGTPVYRCCWRGQGGYVVTEGNHAALQSWAPDSLEGRYFYSYIPLFHYHYVYPSKPNDNRRRDLGFSDQEYLGGEGDYNYITKHPEEFSYKLLTEKYDGERPILEDR